MDNVPIKITGSIHRYAGNKTWTDNEIAQLVSATSSNLNRDNLISNGIGPWEYNHEYGPPVILLEYIGYRTYPFSGQSGLNELLDSLRLLKAGIDIQNDVPDKTYYLSALYKFLFPKNPSKWPNWKLTRTLKQMVFEKQPRDYDIKGLRLYPGKHYDIYVNGSDNPYSKFLNWVYIGAGPSTTDSVDVPSLIFAKDDEYFIYNSDTEKRVYITSARMYHIGLDQHDINDILSSHTRLILENNKVSLAPLWVANWVGKKAFWEDGIPENSVGSISFWYKTLGQ